MNSWLGGRVSEYLNDVPQHCDPITPRVLKVDGCMSLLGNDQRKVLIKPPDRDTQHSDIQSSLCQGNYADRLTHNCFMN